MCVCVVKPYQRRNSQQGTPRIPAARFSMVGAALAANSISGFAFVRRAWRGGFYHSRTRYFRTGSSQVPDRDSGYNAAIGACQRLGKFRLFGTSSLDVFGESMLKYCALGSCRDSDWGSCFGSDCQKKELTWSEFRQVKT